MLYSLNKSYPVEKPTRIRMPDGSTRTGDISEQDFVTAGYSVVDDMPIISDRNKTVEWSYSSGDWLVRDKTQGEINVMISNQWQAIRSQRNTLLEESDWTQLSDAPKYSNRNIDGRTLDTAWKLYRHKLRNITEQEDPFNIVWPEKPTAENAERLLLEERDHLESLYKYNMPSQIEGDEDGN